MKLRSLLFDSRHKERSEKEKSEKEWLKFLLTIVDFFTHSNFIVLSFAIVALAIHWKLSLASLIYLTVICMYYLILPFKLESPQRRRLNGQYKQLDENMHGEHYQQPDANFKKNIKLLIDDCEKEDLKNKKVMIRYRYWVNVVILIFTCI